MTQADKWDAAQQAREDAALATNKTVPREPTQANAAIIDRAEEIYSTCQSNDPHFIRDLRRALTDAATSAPAQEPVSALIQERASALRLRNDFATRNAELWAREQQAIAENAKLRERIAELERVLGFADMVRQATHPSPASWAHYDTARARLSALQEPLTADLAALIGELETAHAGFAMCAERDHDLHLGNTDVSMHATLLRKAIVALKGVA